MNYYDRHAEDLSARYRALSPEVVHAGWASRVLEGRTPGAACDIGAGSGRDAHWLADRDWDVVAVEPSSGMRERAMARGHPGVTWLDDRLPALAKLRALGRRFDLVLVSAVWMHIAPAAREDGLRSLAALLRPGGALVITLRHGEDAAENRARGFYEVSGDELRSLARGRALEEILRVRDVDRHRGDIVWETLVFRMPDSSPRTEVTV